MSRALHARSRLVRVLIAAAVLSSSSFLASCGRSSETQAAPRGPAPTTIRLDHLEHLGLNAVVKGRPVRVVSLYAEAPDYRPTGSPARDGFEGIASLDDAARAAVVYLREYEATGDARDRDEAVRLLDFVIAMEQGDGEFVNFIDSAGRLNRDAPSSRKSMSYWAARSIWALGEAERVLRPRDSARLATIQPVLNRAVSRMTREIDAGRLIGGSTTATAEALLGLLAAQRASQSNTLVPLATRTAQLLAAHSAGNKTTAPWGAYVDRSDASWHAWGARAPEALAIAGSALKRPELVAAARKEADGLWGRFLLAGKVPSTVARDGTAAWYPQIAYGISPIVEGYLALADATGERRYAVYAGLTASWLIGANPAGVNMYDEKTGRTFDGIDGPSPINVNRNSGAESTIEAVLALQRVNSNPDAAEYLHYRPVGAQSASLAGVPDRREYTGPGGRRILLQVGKSGIEIAEPFVLTTPPITLTYWPAANPPETRLANRLAAQWNLENPTVQVRVQPLPAGRSSEEVLLAAIVAKATPDVSSNVSSALLARLVRAGGVVRLDNRVATSARLRERTSAAMLAPLRLPDSGIYAFPWKINPMMLMYNVDLFKEAGIGPPHTQTELLQAWHKLTRDTDGDGRPDRWAMWATLKTTWYERFYDFYPLYLASSGGTTLVNNGKVVFDNDAAVSALTVFRRGFGEGVLPLSNFALGRDPFADGTVAMKIIGPWFLKELNDIKIPSLRYDVTPIPASDGSGPDDSFAFADLRSIAIFSTTKHPDEAARFVAFLTSPAADRMMIEDASQLPYRRGLASDPAFSASLAKWPSLSTYANYVERSRDLDLDPDVVEIFDLISEAYEESAIYRVTPVKAALDKAAREARNIVNAR
ncbi:MAG TPA: sugar ABC transporter substrate-binding protein [Gemmatimonadaceae bacterium]|nr:sugar ABC transporter substrate-binding protein [Gemmatimonadaceae bacterium]